MNLSPIILFVYKRPLHTRKTVMSLQKNVLASQSVLYIFSDGPKTPIDTIEVAKVRHLLKKIKGFKKIIIIENHINLGLANSIIKGTTQVIKRYGKAIVVEDDLVTTPNFLAFMNQALQSYKNDRRIFSVTGYNYPFHTPKNYKDQVYLAYRCTSWGWGTWVDRWNKVDWDIKDYNSFINSDCSQNIFNRGGNDLTTLLRYQMKGYIDSWAIRFCYAHYKNNAYCLHPTVSKVKNIGLDGSGTHKTRVKQDIFLDTNTRNFNLPKNIEPNQQMLEYFSAHFRPSFHSKVITFAKGVAYKIVEILR